MTLSQIVTAVIPYPAIDPVIVRLGPVAIRWYAVAYIVGLLIGWWYVVRLVKDRRLWAGPPFNGRAPMTPDDIGDLFVWIAIGVILGGRLGYVLFYGVFFCGIWTGPACGDLPWGYVTDPVKIIAAWEGGMSFHGGVIGVLLAMALFSRKRKLSLLSVGDLVCCAVPIGLFFGRIANFINGELWGKISDAPWAMVFPNATPPGVPRHPSQLYEALLEGALLFVVLRVLMYRFQFHRRPGLLAGSFLLGYGLFRFLVEFFRDSESKLAGWFSMGQLLSLPMWAAAAFLIWWALTHEPWVPAPQAAKKRRDVSPLRDKLLKIIRAAGPISLADYMMMALYDREYGYYTTRDPFGTAGDFTTSPEISQIFGELIGAFLVQAWEDRGRPSRFHLIELGPGRGTLMADILRAARIRPAFGEAAQITLVEMSPALRKAQAQTIARGDLHWVDALNEVANDAPTFLVANEFFDALPVRQFVKANDGWHERMVGADGDTFVMALAPSPTSLRGVPDAPDGAVYEVSPATLAIITMIAERIAKTGGIALIVDYGHAGGFGDTFQAVRAHQPTDPLAEPGEADLTAHVDFAAVTQAAQQAGGVGVRGPITQGAFLSALGIRERAEALSRAQPYYAADIRAAVDRLTGEKQMGALFKVLCLTDRPTPPPGFP